ncbi:hypothetical protein H2201_004855 [Coniosporium apollinis]|uniref:Uncharacterized protein n=2 Tax=Coniosporium TaxID=2810619 RepID=A0ABQ9NTL0_9PEZI|nr:hypothetical protein H2199_004573 [Cladosporium sp. JES 115]KAJ9664991.1 hypothetical protein H2201_004855 [Coniosporium apollinis]
MGYLLYSFSLVVFVFATALYITRQRWISHIPSFPGSNYMYSRLPSSFRSDIESGFSSSAFDLTGNIESGDSRAGLDERGKEEVRRIMKTRRVNFDEARRILNEERFSRNGIGPDGRPRDPKFVSFS